jgi:hypothetical protein
MAVINFTAAQLEKAAAYRLTPPTSDIVDGQYTSGSPKAITAGVEYRMDFDEAQLLRNFSNGFTTQTGVTKMYDFTNKVGYYQEIEDTPTIVALPNCLFIPSSANAGECIIRMYVNETAPILHDQAIVGYKGIVAEKMGDLFSFYLGDEAGYQIKSKGAYFTFEFEHNGSQYTEALYQYLT